MEGSFLVRQYPKTEVPQARQCLAWAAAAERQEVARPQPGVGPTPGWEAGPPDSWVAHSLEVVPRVKGGACRLSQEGTGADPSSLLTP